MRSAVINSVIELNRSSENVIERGFTLYALRIIWIYSEQFGIMALKIFLYIITI